MSDDGTCTSGPVPTLCPRCNQAPLEPGVTRSTDGAAMGVMVCKRCDAGALRPLTLDALTALRRRAWEAENEHMAALSQVTRLSLLVKEAIGHIQDPDVTASLSARRKEVCGE